MALDRNKIQQNAEKLVRQGKIDQAISLYEQLLEESPRDVNLKNKVGDLLVRAGNIPGAVKVYNQVGDFYAEEGFYLKAIAIYKKINKLDPAAVDCYFKLAELYSKQGLNNDAKSQYQQVADLYVKEGDFTKAAESLEQLLKLDVDNIKVRMRLAEVYSKLGQTGKALNEYQTFGDELVKKAMLEDALKIYEKGLAIDDGHPGLVAGLCKALFELSRHEQLIQRAKDLFAKNRENVAMLGLLAASYEKTGQGELARQVYDKLAGLEPDNPSWRQRLQGAPTPRPAAPAAATAIPDFTEMTGDYSMEELGEVSGQEWEVPDEVPGSEPTSGLEAERDEFIVEHTTEAEVFIKYGLVEKAIDNLEAIVNHYPDEVESLRRLKDLYLETGNKARAAEKCVDLARIARQKGEMDRALALLGEARAHDPQVRIDRAAPSETGGLAATAGAFTDLESGGGLVPVELEGGPPPSGVEIDFDAVAGKPGGLSTPSPGEAIEFSLEESAPSEDPPGIDFEFDEPTGAGGSPGSPGDEGIEIFEEAFRAPRRDAASPPLSFEPDLGGAEEADDSIFEQEAEFLSKAEAAEPAAETPIGGGGGIGEDSLEEIFKEFKKGVEAQLDTEDYETHYNLGIAYHEMGLVDEAIAEFQLASKDASRAIECCSHLGQCFREKGMPKLALKWYQKALESLDTESPQYVAIKYDLGEAYQEAGDRERALEQFIDVLGLDAGFRDVSDRIEKLQEEADGAAGGASE